MGTWLEVASGCVLACVLTLQQTTQVRAEPAHSSVLVMRHCVRSVLEDAINDVDGLRYFDNYSRVAWPKFDVPREYCLPRGTKLIKATGTWLAKNWDLPKPVRVIADDCERDWETASTLLKGMQEAAAQTAAADGQSMQQFLIASEFFQPSKRPACPKIKGSAAAAAIRSQMEAVPHPKDMNRSISRLGEVLGVGAAGHWWTTGCNVSDTGGVKGACAAASEFIERLLFEWGGGFPELGWGRLTPAEVPPLLQVHAWFRMITSGVPQLVRVKQATIIRVVLDILKANEKGTTIFVGHDTQLNALGSGVGLQWDASPFPVNATLPGSVLRFDRAAKGSNVDMRYAYIANFSSLDGALTVVPATFTSAAANDEGPGTAPFEQFKARAEQGSDPACVEASPPAWGVPAGERKVVQAMSSVDQAQVQI